MDSIQRKLTLSIIHLAVSPNELSFIEIWDNTGDLINPSYQGVSLDKSDDHQFLYYDYGEIIRIDHDQCEILNP